MSDRFPTRLDKTKWLKSRICGCDECRFYSMEERPECPMKNEPGAIQLWYIDPDMFGYKDYVESEAFSPPAAFTEKEEVAEVETDQNSPT